jgi:hypothetical protein
MASVPIIAAIRITWPVAANAYEDELAVIIRPEESERVVRP